MSVAARATASWPVRFGRNLAAGWRTLLRPPPRGAHRPAWPARSRLFWGAVAAIAAVSLAMVLLDAWSLGRVRDLPAAVIVTFGYVTDLGLSGWFLYPLGIALLLIAAISSPAQPRFVRDTLAVLSVRIGFLFAAIAVPGLTVAIIKRLIGRARPFVDGHDTWAYQLFVWRADYASLPSGHATTAFAAAVAIGAVWPQARVVLFVYAVLVAVSRVVVTAHHPSDVIAGAVFGVVGAILVRNWFAHRRLGFTVSPEGAVRPVPGPSWPRMRTVARRLTSARSTA